MGKKAGAKSPATKLDKAIAQARSEVERRQKQLADASRALARLEARRAPVAAPSPKPKPAAATTAKPAAASKRSAAKKPTVAKPAAKPATRKPATRKPAAAKSTTMSRRPTRTTRSRPSPGKTS